MIHYDDMAATGQTAPSRTATGVRMDASTHSAALPGIEQHRGRSFAPGGA